MGRAVSGVAVLVRGFDYKTSQEEIASHMSSVGTVCDVQIIDQGSARVTYSFAEEAQAANQQLQQTKIAGNSRYIDVLVLDPNEFLAGHNIDTNKAEQFLSMTPEQQQTVMARGSLSSARDPTAVLIQRMKQAYGAAVAQSFNSAGGKCSVLVRGFDYGTSADMIGSHMSSVGTVNDLQMIEDGSACVTYSNEQEARAAVEQLQQSVIDGNSRFIDVLFMDPEDFLTAYRIDAGRAAQFRALTPEQQQAVMARGTLATARDPTAVLVQRMKGLSKGDFGPAPGRGTGMKGGMGKGPYGGCDMGKGGMGKGDMYEQGAMMMMQMFSSMKGGKWGGMDGGMGMGMGGGKWGGKGGGKGWGDDWSGSKGKW